MQLAGQVETLKQPRFRWFFAARTVSLAGTAMAPVALAFAILHSGGSASDLGLVLAARFVAMLVFLLVGGVIADRWSRRTVLQVSHALTAATQGTVALMVLTDHVSIPAIILLEAANGAVSAFTLPALQGIVPQLVEPEQRQQATALMGFSRNITMVIGPAAAALLVAGPGAGWALAFDAFTYVVAIVLLTRVDLPGVIARGTSMVEELKEGWSAFTAHSWLWVSVVVVSVTNAIGAGAWTVLGPVIAETHSSLGVRGWGLVAASSAAGAVVMALILVRVELKRPLLVGSLVMSLMAVQLFVLGVYPHTWMLAIAAFIGGAALDLYGTAWTVAMLDHIPEQSLSRVSSYDLLGSYTALPAGAFVYGQLGTQVDLRTLLVASSLAFVVLTLAMLLLPSLRQLRRAVPEGANGEHAAASA